ncbi:uncharacterized protein JN550_012607 [Neoarthrinium moseri]|uniref:uncharacterized protein n=1 Tax=Neoarthrinium moseri TaxID=1658444 RepID=UPI001FDCEAC7|nr:uncharacterized protein JN550_012607 [Neoarthrinium moseri]KAI1858474.1 hypothetical protein JN550_012607 [Neoarthrinium moseri]
MESTTVPTPPITPAPFGGVKPLSEGLLAIEPASVADAPAMAVVGATVFTETFGHSVSKEDLAEFLSSTYSAEAMVAELADPTKVTLVARSTLGKVAGIAQLHRGQTHPSVHGTTQDLATLQKLYVDSSMHGQGIGTKIVAYVENLARSEGFKQLWLTVWEENTKAQKLYERLGYTKSGETEFVTGSCIQTDYVFAKKL